MYQRDVDNIFFRAWTADLFEVLSKTLEEETLSKNTPGIAVSKETITFPEMHR